MDNMEGYQITKKMKIMAFIAFLGCWAKNTKNKYQYAFEDYQRALTHNLAHDIKTPLAVIGGSRRSMVRDVELFSGERHSRRMQQATPDRLAQGRTSLGRRDRHRLGGRAGTQPRGCSWSYALPSTIQYQAFSVFLPPAVSLCAKNACWS